MKDRIREQLIQAGRVLDDFMADEKNLHSIVFAAEMMAEAVGQGDRIIACGNGGSMCDAMHFAEELTGRFRNDRKAIPALAISDPSHITCTANDYGFEAVFSRFIEAHGRRGDVLLAISTSGNSANILKAAETARMLGMKVVGLTGRDGGKLAGWCDCEIRAPHTEFSDRTQEIHIKVIHILIDLLEGQLFQT